MKKFVKNNWHYILSVLIPLVYLLVWAKFNGVWFGAGGHLVQGDAAAQSIPSMMEFWRNVHNGESLQYTWHIAGGYNTVGMICGLFDPISWLYLASPIESALIYEQISMLLWWLLSSLTVTAFFTNTRLVNINENRKLIALMCGLEYCLGAAMLGYLRYPSFAMIMSCFPILLLLLEKMVYEGKWKVYTLLLAYCIYSNFYLSFCVCVLIFFWFILLTRKQLFKNIHKLALTSILAAVMGSWNMVFTFLASRSRINDAGSVETRSEFYNNFKILDFRTFFRSLFAGNDMPYPYMIKPNIYCSVLVLTLAVLYIFTKYNQKKGILAGITFFFATGFFIGPVFLLLHCLNAPNGVYFRFSNIFSFLLIYMGVKTIEHLDEIKKIYKVISMITLILLWGVLFFTETNFENLTLVYITTLFLIIIYSVLVIWNMMGGISKKVLLYCFAVVLLIELAISSISPFNLLYNEGGIVDEDLVALLDELDVAKGERIVLENDMNLGEKYGYDAIAGFQSSLDMDTWNLFYDLGMGGNEIVQIYYNGINPLLNSMLNVKYIISRQEKNIEYTRLRSEFVDKYGYYVYEVENNWGFGYVLNDSIMEWDHEYNSVYSKLSDFAYKATGLPAIFADMNVDISCEDAYGEILDNVSGYDGVYEYRKRYINGEDNGLYAYFNAPGDYNTYVHLFTGSTFTVEAYVDGEKVANEPALVLQTELYLGHLDKGQKVELYFIPTNSDYEEVMFQMQVGVMSDGYFENVNNIIKMNSFDIVDFHNTYIKAEVNTTNDGICSTLVQDQPGFEVYVDGEKTETVAVGGAFIGVPLSKGEHTIEIYYETPGLKVANAAMIIGIIIFVLTYIAEMQIKKHKVNLQLEN